MARMDMPDMECRRAHVEPSCRSCLSRRTASEVSLD